MNLSRMTRPQLIAGLKSTQAALQRAEFRLEAMRLRLSRLEFELGLSGRVTSAAPKPGEEELP
jgi:hypothetical protein